MKLHQLIPWDKRVHFAMGIGAMIYGAVAYVLWTRVGWGAAMPWLTTVFGIYTEVYQKARKEGTASKRDAAFTAAPGWIALAVWAALRWL